MPKVKFNLEVHYNKDFEIDVPQDIIDSEDSAFIFARINELLDKGEFDTIQQDENISWIGAAITGDMFPTAYEDLTNY